MNFKNFLVISLILVSVFFLFGCTSSNCGDGICQSGEESFCYTDCGTILPSTTVSISVIDATSGKLINTNNNIFIELPDKDDLDCSNPFFNTLCEARYYLDSNPKKLETFSVLLGNVDSLLIGVGADGYKMTDVRLNISKDDSSDFTISLEPKDDLLVDLKEGDICEIDSQCYAGNNNYAVCAADIYGIKRCNVNTTINPELNLSSCILDASAFEIKKDKSVCLNETQKVTCTGVEWSKPIDCVGECRNGSCVSEVYSPKTKTFKFLKDVQYGLTLPVQPSSNSIREIFEELPAGSMVYKWIKNGDKSYWSSSTKGGRTGTFNPDNNLFAGEGFILKSSQDIDFKFSGDTIASTTYTISEKFTPIGIPTCPEEYTFSKIVKEVSAIEPLCNTVSLQNVGSSYPTWWSSDPSVELKGTKEDLQVLSYESIWIRCGDGVVLAEGEKVEFDSFEWSPSCSKKIATCETFGYDGGEVDCDSVNEEGECIIFNIDNCYKNGNFKEIYAVRAWDPIYEGSANYETYGPFYYKRMCNGLAENCVDSLLEFTSGDLKGTIIPIKGYGKDLNGNVFEMEGISWVELNTSLNFDA
ncbi:MAG TPA: hypothetical protein PKK60_03475, partial [archaeon]|nr:hypothetical protein [archaeon]